MEGRMQLAFKVPCEVERYEVIALCNCPDALKTLLFPVGRSDVTSSFP